LPTFRVIGAGRAGQSVERALTAAGWTGLATLHHDDDIAGAGAGSDLLIVAVPDAHVAAVAARVEPDPATVVVHLAGSLGTTVLESHPRRGVLHPVLALPEPDEGARRLRAGATFAIAGDPLVREVVTALGGTAIEVADDDRPAHHAACAIAANHTVALLATVERAAARAGAPLAPYLELARRAVDLVAEHGPAAALTGPVARGDWATVASHIAALPEVDRPAYLALATEGARLAGHSLARGLLQVCGPGGAPEVVHDRAGFRKRLDEVRAAGLTVGLVPTMGALHDGHASLVRRAAAECDVVAVTVFVNPLQFDRPDDLDAYPRTLDADVAIAADAGASVVFAPSMHEMYGDGAAARVHVEGLADRLEGAARPGHFDGVATVVTKLFALAGPCRAYFGEKDFQQVAVVRRLVADLDLPIDVIPCATVRAADGLALSSRNALLTPEQRQIAPALPRALRMGALLVAGGERDADTVRAAVVAELEREPALRIDRVDVVDAATLAPPTASTTEWRILAAAFCGTTRLIDNVGAAV
jgi:pantoate--beta-alanine ligase